MSNASDNNDGRYDSTRKAWETIWNGASIPVELEVIEAKRAQTTINAYLPYMNPDGVHLEAGSGLSAVVMTLRQRGYNLIGMDYAVNALEISRDYDPSLILTAGDVHHLPFADNSLDSYLSFGVLEHFEHGMLPALREAYRILRPGGVLVLTIPYPNLVYRLVQLRRRLSCQSALTDDEFYESTYTRDQLIEQASAAGFEVLETIPTSHDFTLWGLGWPFQGAGYYRTTPLAERLGELLARLLPWPFNYMTLVIARK